MREVLFNPYYSVIVVLLLWGLGWALFVKWGRISARWWVIFEAVWILCGLFGVIGLALENRVRQASHDLQITDRWIEEGFEMLLDFTESASVCWPNGNTGIWSDREFKKRESHREKICQWVSAVHEETKRAFGCEPTSKISIPTLPSDSSETHPECKFLIPQIERINRHIQHREDLRSLTNNGVWQGFLHTLGLLALIVAISLRLTMVSKKFQDSKKATAQPNSEPTSP